MTAMRHVRPTHSPLAPRVAEEAEAFLEGLSRLWGVDLSRYHKPPLIRRLRRRVELEGVGGLHELLARAIADAACLGRVQGDVLLHVTSMFRDAGFYGALREQVPRLATYPAPRIWIAGCSTGPELYSYLVMLQEAGLAGRSRVYATDLSPEALAQARSGLFDSRLLPEYERAYQEAGGQGGLGAYLETSGEQVRLKPELLKPVVFAVHNLLTDGSFNQFHIISCRNVITYFDAAGQRQALDLMHDSLVPLGLLALGTGESMVHSAHARDYAQLQPGQPLYRRMR